MGGKTKMKARIEARNTISHFFRDKRKALGVKPFFNFSPDNMIKRQFLVQMNSISRTAEIKAMSLVDKGAEWQTVFEEAQIKFEKLKKDTVKGLMLGEAIGKPNEAVARLIMSL